MEQGGPAIEPGIVILFNGVSGAGKSRITNALKRMIGEDWALLAADDERYEMLITQISSARNTEAFQVIMGKKWESASGEERRTFVCQDSRLSEFLKKNYTLDIYNEALIQDTLQQARPGKKVICDTVLDGLDGINRIEDFVKRLHDANIQVYTVFVHTTIDVIANRQRNPVAAVEQYPNMYSPQTSPLSMFDRLLVEEACKNAGVIVSGPEQDRLFLELSRVFCFADRPKTPLSPAYQYSYVLDNSNSSITPEQHAQQINDFIARVELERRSVDRSFVLVSDVTRNAEPSGMVTPQPLAGPSIVKMPTPERPGVKEVRWDTL